MLHRVNAEPAVASESLTVVRGDTEVLHGLSFAVPRGRITGLLGPSGCGKTTLMRCVVGVQIIESGAVDVLGLPAGSAELRARVGYVTQAVNGIAMGSSRARKPWSARSEEVRRKCITTREEVVW
jgi:ABC-type multidrug transport system ATPase subunit